MTVTVEVVDHTGLVAGCEAVGGLVQAVLDAEGCGGEISLAFVDEAVMIDLNSRYREAEGSTDVLSFDYADGDGEIALCPAVIMRYAGEDGRDPAEQLGWTLIHGALHLAGYDHETDQGEMRAREQELLRLLDARVRDLAMRESGE
jgi:probable rRNA maturation factor